MVRTTIACARCRRSKTKCIHSGVAPCRSCLKSGRTSPGECVLSGPFEQENGSRKPRTRSERSVSQPAQHPLDPISRQGYSVPISPGNQMMQGSNVHQNVQQRTLEEILEQTSKPLLLQVTTLFYRKFPEIVFLHLPTMSLHIKKSEFFGNQGILVAILALCTRLLPESNEKEALLPPEEYAALVRNHVAVKVTEPPCLETVQTLLIISIYEWGGVSGYQAWMYSGMAIRMMQSLEAIEKNPPTSAIISEIKNRTYWSCFIMDRMIFCGITQPQALPLSKMKISLPIGEQDFAFGSSANHYSNGDIETGTGGSEIYWMCDFYYSVLIRGFDIWSRVLDFIIGGGRRRPGMSKSANCPWAPGSPWNIIFEDLKLWRHNQSERLRYYGENFIPAQVSLGQGESTAYVNLIYYLCILFLHREYIPFLPTSETAPRGPIDAPLLEDVAPDGWWPNNSRDLFEAADSITNILCELEDSEANLMTPFTGFCAFCAGSMHIYIAAFPNLNLGRSLDAANQAKRSISYLSTFKTVWKMGEGWYETIQHISSLYQRVISNRVAFLGKTREDFVALEASIHDSTGSSPAQARSIALQLDDEVPNGTERAAALSLQELAAGPNPQGQDNSPSMQQSIQHAQGMVAPQEDLWSQIWPLWGEDPLIPFAVGGLPFDFNLDFVTRQNSRSNT